MNNKLKKYHDFLNESSKSEKLPNRLLPSKTREDYLILRGDFRDTIEDITGYYDTYFSNLAQGSNDPDEDYNEIKKLISRKGWTIESIKNLFSPEVDKICKYNFFNLISGRSSDEFKSEMDNRTLKSQLYQPFREKSLDELSGYIDMFLYKLVEELGLKNTFNYATDDKVYLGGEGWQVQMVSNEYDDINEYLIKCAYGYHQTKYGKLFLKQAGVSEKELIEKAIKDFQFWFEGEWMNIIDKIIPDGNGRNISSKMKFKEFFLIEDDRIIIYCRSISEYLKENELDVSTEEVIADFINSFSIFKLGTGESPLDLEIVNKEEIIIWGEFDEFH